MMQYLRMMNAFSIGAMVCMGLVALILIILVGMYFAYRRSYKKYYPKATFKDFIDLTLNC